MMLSKLRSSIISITKLLGLYIVLRFLKNITAHKNKSFGQTGEDELILKYFTDEKYSYIDIGSGEPILRSNSYRFYKDGKSGILVDPLSSNRRLSKLIRPRDTFVQCLIGITPGFRTFWEFHDYEYSSMNEEVVSKLLESKKARLKKTMTLEVLTLSNLVELLDEPNIPWFLSIDVEGVDFEVIRSYDFKINRPRVICIEDHEYVASGFSSQHEYILKLGYKLVDQTSLSLIYLNNNVS